MPTEPTPLGARDFAALVAAVKAAVAEAVATPATARSSHGAGVSRSLEEWLVQSQVGRSVAAPDLHRGVGRAVEKDRSRYLDRTAEARAAEDLKPPRGLRYSHQAEHTGSAPLNPTPKAGSVLSRLHELQRSADSCEREASA
jgi:hypothetical protein